jgi:hypothetical protein
MCFYVQLSQLDNSVFPSNFTKMINLSYFLRVSTTKMEKLQNDN